MFGADFDQDLTTVEWPDSLEMLAFGDLFAQSLQRSGEAEGRGRSSLPPRPKKLQLSAPSIQINPSTLPVGLCHLGCYSECSFCPSEEWPPGLTHVLCAVIHENVVNLPPKLETLMVGCIHVPIERSTFPKMLKSLLMDGK